MAARGGVSTRATKGECGDGGDDGGDGGGGDTLPPPPLPPSSLNAVAGSRAAAAALPPRRKKIEKNCGRGAAETTTPGGSSPRPAAATAATAATRRREDLSVLLALDDSPQPADHAPPAVGVEGVPCRGGATDGASDAADEVVVGGVGPVAGDVDHTLKKTVFSSSYRGVSFDKRNNRWKCRCAKTWIGYFDSEQNAALAYNEHARDKGLPLNDIGTGREKSSEGEMRFLYTNHNLPRGEKKMYVYITRHTSRPWPGGKKG